MEQIIFPTIQRLDGFLTDFKRLLFVSTKYENTLIKLESGDICMKEI